MRITIGLLERLNVCGEQRKAFVDAFPDGIEILEGSDPDPKIVARIVKANINPMGLFGRLFYLGGWSFFCWACDEANYAQRKASGTAFADYNAALVIARRTPVEYDKAKATATTVYREALSAAESAYRETVTTSALRLLADSRNIRPAFRQE